MGDAMRSIQIDTVARELQSWLDWHARDYAPDQSPPDDAHIMAPPVWPSRRVLKAWIDLLRRLDAEHAAPSPPAPGGVPIRIAVAMDQHGDAMVGNIPSHEDDEVVWDDLASMGCPIRAAIISATVAPPVVAEIEGRVEAGGE